MGASKSLGRREAGHREYCEIGIRPEDGIAAHGLLRGPNCSISGFKKADLQSIKPFESPFYTGIVRLIFCP